MAEVGSAFVSILPSAKGFGSKLDSEVGGQVEGAGKSVGSKFGTAIKAGAVAVMAGGALAASFLKDAVGEAREAQKVGALTVSTIKATGGAANVTAKQVGDLASAISNKTGIDDEAIQSGANMLLTFKNIRNEAGAGNDVFSQTTRTLTDMSAALGTDAKTSAIQLGKALNDPIKGISALSRVGVTFTEGQKKQIKAMVESGNVMGAQKLILKELNSEFGGAAAAQATAGDKAAVAWGNLKEQIGTAILPMIDRLATAFTTKIVPAVSGFIAGMQSGAGAGGQFVSVVKAIGSSLLAIGSFLNQHRTLVLSLVGVYAVARTALVAYRVATAASAAASMFMAGAKGIETVATVTNTGMTTANTAAHAAGRIGLIAHAVVSKAAAAGQWLLNAALSANPIGLVVVAIAALVAGLVVAYKNSETFRKVIDTAFNAIKAVVAAVIPYVRAVIGAAFEYIKTVAKVWAAVFRGDWKGAWDAVKSILSAAWGVIKPIVSAGFSAVKAVASSAWAAVKQLTASAWDAVKGAVSAGIAAVVGFVKSLPGKAAAALAGLAGAIVGVVTAAFARMLDAAQRGGSAVVDYIRAQPGRIISGLGNLGSLLYGAGQDLILGMINGIKAMAGSLVSAASDVVGSAINAAKSKLGINSPSTVFMEIGEDTGEGFRLGLAGSQSSVERQMARLALPPAPAVAGPRVAYDAVAPGGGSDVGAKLDRVAAILERMPRDYQLGMRQGI